jgi:type II secretory pathway component PulK
MKSNSQSTNHEQIPNPKSQIRNAAQRRGSVLLLVLVVVALFTLSAFTFYDLTYNYRRATASHGSKLQATAAAESGIELIVNHLNKAPEDIRFAGGLYHNAAFQGITVVDDIDPRRRARFTVLAPAQVNGVLGDVRFGLENESARINLNTLLLVDQASPGAARDLLLYLPGMTELIADAILDWMDTDDEPREFGAESESYAGLYPPYAPANAPFQTVEELLLVQGVTPQLLYGADVNRNFLIDQDEVARQSVSAADNFDGSMNRGWSAFFTLHSAEANLRLDGTPKIDVNGSDLSLLYDDLDAISELTEAEVNFIIAYRLGGEAEGDDEEEEEDEEEGNNGGQGGGGQGGGGQGGGGQGGGGQGGGRGGGGGQGGADEEEEGQGGQGGGRGGGQGGGQGEAGGQGGGGQQQLPPREVDAADLDFDSTSLEEAQGRQSLTTILDLIGATIEFTPPDDTQAVRVESPFSEELGQMARYLPILMENLSVNPSAVIPGRININQAPSAILSGIPGLLPEQVDRIISNRDLEVTVERPDRAYETWLLTEGIVTLDEMKELMKFVTAGGNVYRAQIVGFFDEPGPTTRIEVIIDSTSPGATKMVFLRDLSKLGAGFTPASLGAVAEQVP